MRPYCTVIDKLFLFWLTHLGGDSLFTSHSLPHILPHILTHILTPSRASSDEFFGSVYAAVTLQETDVRSGGLLPDTCSDHHPQSWVQRYRHRQVSQSIRQFCILFCFLVIGVLPVASFFLFIIFFSTLSLTLHFVSLSSSLFLTSQEWFYISCRTSRIRCQGTYIRTHALLTLLLLSSFSYWILLPRFFLHSTQHIF